MYATVSHFGHFNRQVQWEWSAADIFVQCGKIPALLEARVTVRMRCTDCVLALNCLVYQHGDAKWGHGTCLGDEMDTF